MICNLLENPLYYGYMEKNLMRTRMKGKCSVSCAVSE